MNPAVVPSRLRVAATASPVAVAGYVGPAHLALVMSPRGGAGLLRGRRGAGRGVSHRYYQCVHQLCTQCRQQQHVELEPRGGPAPAGQTPKSRAMSMHTRSCPDSEATAATRAVTGSRCAHRLGLSEPESEVGPRPNLRRSPTSWLLACAATSQAATSRPLQS